jgi:LSD1 subclass zinc finger protein
MSTLQSTLIECQPFKDVAATIVCIGCFKPLAYPSGARKVKCGNCTTVTDGIKIRCTSCSHAMRVALNANHVRCERCQYQFRPQATLKIKPPSWALQQQLDALELPLRIILDDTVSRTAQTGKPRELMVKVVPNQPLRASTAQWEDSFGCDFRSVAFYKGQRQLDTTKTPMALELSKHDIITIQRAQRASSTTHEFASAQFGTPTNCAYCKEFIWGVYHQGASAPSAASRCITDALTS